MKFRPQLSDGSTAMLAVAEALVNYAPSFHDLERWAQGIWPRLFIYHGHTHARFMPEGKGGPSFYVDTTEQQPPVPMYPKPPFPREAA